MTHLSPEELAGYLDADLPGEEQRQVELHLASCTECREELADVRRLQVRRRRRWSLALIPAAAAAAALVAITLPRHARVPSDVRAGPDAELPLAIVSPTPSAEVAGRPSTFIWRSAGPGASYTFTLQAGDGRVLWTSATTDTLVALPDSVAFTPGRTWFWMVDALLGDGRLRSTGVKRLSTRP